MSYSQLTGSLNLAQEHHLEQNAQLNMANALVDSRGGRGGRGGRGRGRGRGARGRGGRRSPSGGAVAAPAGMPAFGYDVDTGEPVAYDDGANQMPPLVFDSGSSIGSDEDDDEEHAAAEEDYGEAAEEYRELMREMERAANAAAPARAPREAYGSWNEVCARADCHVLPLIQRLEQLDVRKGKGKGKAPATDVHRVNADKLIAAIEQRGDSVNKLKSLLANSEIGACAMQYV